MSIREVDPFDLPDWLGDDAVVWRAVRVRDGIVEGRFEAGPEILDADLLPVDRAYPQPIVEDGIRQVVHRAWQHRQVAILDKDGRLTIAVPGLDLDAAICLTAVGRFARAIGSVPERFSVMLKAT